MKYDKYLSAGARDIPPSGIRKFFDIVSEMPDAISLGVGEPDFITPWSIRDAAIKSMQKGLTQYTSNRGLAQLRGKLCDYLGRFDLSYSPDEIVVTVGASEAIDLALRAIVNAGDEVLIPEPSYVSYAPLVKICGGVPVGVPLCADSGFKLLPSQLESVITKRTKALIFAYPNNPTGAIMEKEYILPLLPIIKKHDLLVISDEIYCELTYVGKHVSIASFDGMKERTVVINGFSKAFAMTGFRLGYFAAPKELADVMLKIHQYAIMCAPTFSQYGALDALTKGLADGFAVVEHMRREYDARRRFLLGCFADMGIDCFEPRGAFYIYPCVESLGLSGEQFAKRLLAEQRVAVVPGSAFAGASAEDKNYFVRCCYAVSMRSLKEASARIAEFVRELKPV